MLYSLSFPHINDARIPLWEFTLNSLTETKTGIVRQAKTRTEFYVGLTIAQRGKNALIF